MREDSVFTIEAYRAHRKTEVIATTRSGRGGIGGWIALLMGVVLLAGCASTNPIAIDPAPYAGPPARVEPGERTHIATFTMPTGGWGLKFDRVRERFDAQQVFVTLRRPAPNESTSQALVDQAVDTRVRLARRVEVYARIEEKDQPDSGYRLATSSQSP